MISLQKKPPIDSAVLNDRNTPYAYAQAHSKTITALAGLTSFPANDFSTANAAKKNARGILCGSLSRSSPFVTYPRTFFSLESIFGHDDVQSVFPVAPPGKRNDSDRVLRDDQVCLRDVEAGGDGRGNRDRSRA